MLILPKFSVDPAQALTSIVALSLDVLVFTEIGMTHDIYFLAQSRLAKRTLSFWGHAITSGIVDSSGLTNKNAFGEIQSPEQRGGPDYFISSVLFEKCWENCNNLETCQATPQAESMCYSETQKKYSERLLLQEGMTTYFYHPPLPLRWYEIDEMIPAPVVVDVVSEYRVSLLPDKLSFLAFFHSSNEGRAYDENMVQLRAILENYDISENDIKMYCIPQTLYKLSPGNIDIIKRLLVADPSGLLVLLDGELSHPEQKQLITNEFPSSSLDRIIFLRKLNQREYMTLLAISDVVLDTFPVGGGRSSFAIFSTGTPIVMLYPATSILQLTYGMYQTMGIDCTLCIAYDARSYIAASIEIASNKAVQSALRRDILKNKHRLFENRTVIEEWEHMLKFVLSVPRPVPFRGVSSAAAASEVTSAVSITALGEGNADVADNDNVNWLRDVKRVYENSDRTALGFEEWVKELPLNLSLAFSFPYSDPPMRLSLIIPNYTNVKDAIMDNEMLQEGVEEIALMGGAAKNTTQGDFKLLSNDKEGISLGVILRATDNSMQMQTPHKKLAIFNKTIHSLKLALQLNNEESFQSRGIKEVVVADDGTEGMSVKDRALFSATFPSFHFIFERSKDKVPSSNMKSWYKLKALSSIIKLAKYRYLLLIPSNFRAASNPHLSLPLLEASASQTSSAETPDSLPKPPTVFSFVIRFALHLLNGYTNTTGKVDGFGLTDITEYSGIGDSLHKQRAWQDAAASGLPTGHVFRQAAHVVLLNTLASEKNLNWANIIKTQYSNGDCKYDNALVQDTMLAGGDHLVVGKCRKGSGEHTQPFIEMYDTSAPPLAPSRHVGAVRSPYCACSGAANESYLDTSTYFGGYIDEDIRDICGQNYEMKGRSFLSSMDSIVNETYRSFTCLLALFNADARKKMKLRNEEVSYLKKVQELYLQPSLWDIEAVSFIIQGLEKEFLLESGGTDADGKRVSARYRHEPRAATPVSGQGKEETRKSNSKKSLVKKSSRVDALYHARGEVVFDRADAFEYHNESIENTDCQYINTTAAAAGGAEVAVICSDVFQCGGRKHPKKTSSSNSATRFAKRLLSAGVKVAYLSAELFSEK
jgi:hypothetical protein